MKCPKCNEDIDHVINDKHIFAKGKKRQIYFPLFDKDKKPIIKNWIRIDFIVILFIISILLLLLGFKQVNQQCFDLLKDPCVTASRMGCDVSGLGIFKKDGVFNFTEIRTTSEGETTP